MIKTEFERNLLQQPQTPSNVMLSNDLEKRAFLNVCTFRATYHLEMGEGGHNRWLIAGDCLPELYSREYQIMLHVSKGVIFSYNNFKHFYIRDYNFFYLEFKAN